MKSIVIIGGGFTGTLTAINLARFSPISIDITIISDTWGACRGVAYNTRNGSHLLNVVARNMSALADQPNHFVEWLATRSEYLDVPAAALRETFAPRRVYGDYLNNLFQWCAGTIAAGKNIRMGIIQEQASDLALEGEGARITLRDGRTLRADKVVLAVGNQAPAPFRVRGLDAHSAKYIGNPWQGWEKRLPSADQDLLLIGTGLTMVDTFLTLRDMGWRGKILAVSRNGLLPLSHYKGFDYPDPLAEEKGVISLRRLFALCKRQCRAALARGLNPAIVVDKLRPHTQRIWQGFSLAEKKRFNRHFRTRWNVVRHRIAPEIHQQLRAAMAAGRLEVIKGRLREVREAADQMRVLVAGAGGERWLAAGAVINCTGPQESYVPATTSLFQSLFAQGIIQPDEMNMGSKAADFSVVDAQGKSSQTVFALGALLKGTLWETVAVPELRSQTFRLAESIIGQLTENTGAKSALAEITAEVLEYSI